MKSLLAFAAPDRRACAVAVGMRHGILRLPRRGGPMIGQGGASKRIDGIDIWVIGAPPREFQIIGYIEDSRPGGPPSMAQRNPALAALAKQQGGAQF
jgi:hypothetical protein